VSVWTRTPRQGVLSSPLLNRNSKGGRYVEECLALGGERWFSGQRACGFASHRTGRTAPTARYGAAMGSPHRCKPALCSTGAVGDDLRRQRHWLARVYAKPGQAKDGLSLARRADLMSRGKTPLSKLAARCTPHHRFGRGLPPSQRSAQRKSTCTPTFRSMIWAQSFADGISQGQGTSREI